MPKNLTEIVTLLENIEIGRISGYAAYTKDLPEGISAIIKESCPRESDRPHCEYEIHFIAPINLKVLGTIYKRAGCKIKWGQEKDYFWLGNYTAFVDGEKITRINPPDLIEIVKLVEKYLEILPPR